MLNAVYPYGMSLYYSRHITFFSAFYSAYLPEANFHLCPQVKPVEFRIVAYESFQRIGNFLRLETRHSFTSLHVSLQPDRDRATRLNPSSRDLLLKYRESTNNEDHGIKVNLPMTELTRKHDHFFTFPVIDK